MYIPLNMHFLFFVPIEAFEQLRKLRILGCFIEIKHTSIVTKTGTNCVSQSPFVFLKIRKRLGLEAGMFLVLGTCFIRDIELWPLDIDRGVVPWDAAFAFRIIDISAFVNKLSLVTQSCCTEPSE